MMVCEGNVYREEPGKSYHDKCSPYGDEANPNERGGYWWPDSMAGEYVCAECGDNG